MLQSLVTVGYLLLSSLPEFNPHRLISHSLIPGQGHCSPRLSPQCPRTQGLVATISVSLVNPGNFFSKFDQHHGGELTWCCLW